MGVKNENTTNNNHIIQVHYYNNITNFFPVTTMCDVRSLQSVVLESRCVLIEFFRTWEKLERVGAEPGKMRPW